MAKAIMIQGTMSSAGKSFLCAALARVFKQDGYRVAPFKSQNMALNSYVTKEGLEMGRAQVMQAEAAGIEPVCAMNPILLKPTSDVGSQVIVNGEVLGNMRAREYFAYKKELIPEILKAYHKLEEMADIIVIEGAGSPAEINLKDNDIVNMGLAKLVNAPVFLAGDIDRGGVFAQLLGTVMLLPEDEKNMVKGLIINKFRGDKTILDPGIAMLEERAGIKVVATVPYMDVQVEDEDSLTERFAAKANGQIDFAVIRYPHISNFTDFNVFEQFPEISVRYVTHPEELGEPDMIFLPGSKNTITDLIWMRETGIEAKLTRLAGKVPIFGICGGYQMLGMRVTDPEGVESREMVRESSAGVLPEKLHSEAAEKEENPSGMVDETMQGDPAAVSRTRDAKENFAATGKSRAVAAEKSGFIEVNGESLGTDPWSNARAGAAVREIRGMGLLPVETALLGEKTRTQTQGVAGEVDGIFSVLSGLPYEGYEIHMGRTVHAGEAFCEAGELSNDTGADTAVEQDVMATEYDGQESELPVIVTSQDGMVAGSYVHGIFDTAEMAGAIAQLAAARAGISLGQGTQMNYRAFKETQYDKMAEILRAHIDMDYVYSLLGLPGPKKS